MRLIDANALKVQLQREIDTYYNEDSGGIHTAMEALDEIDNAPTVEAEPVRHGHWILYYETDNGRCLRCSKCQGLMVFIVGDGREDNYCPNCGAKMDEVEE